MLSTLRLRAVMVFLVALTTTLALVCPSAEAGTRHFAIVGGGAGPNGLPLPGQPARFHWVVGYATELRTHFGIGSVKTDSAEGPDENGQITGNFGSGDRGFVFVGSDGDRLAVQYGRTDFGAKDPGYFELTILDVLNDGSLVVEALWIAEFVVQPDWCTGKFAGTTGSWKMFAYSEPFILDSDDPVYYWWEGHGKLDFEDK